MSEQERTDRLRLGRLAPTSSACREKQALHPPVGRGRGRVGATRLATVDAAGDRRHIRVHPRLCTRHSTSMSNIIRSRHIRSSLNFRQVISIRRGMSITRGIRLNFTRGIKLSSLLSSSMSSLLSSSILNSILSSIMQSLLWRTRMGAFQGALMRCHFYRTSVNTWHAGFGTIK